jgi:LPXTG-motif cell wall-anchored protein
MIARRFTRIAGATVIGLSTMALGAATAAAQTSDTSVPPTTEPVDDTTPPSTVEAAASTQSTCEIMTADVDGGTATFTVGPDGCSPQVGPISFSTYELPSGQITPYEDQVLIAHADGNGSVYGAGTYTLTASLGAALNWQADLYFGESIDQPPHASTIAVDAQTGQVPVTTTACGIVESDVDGGTATFTVGPDGCSPEVGPISFSTYELPSGQIMPYEEQVLIAHADGNGSMYGAGSYTLTASLGAALNWQADLYFGESDNQPPHPNMIAVDAQTGVVAAPATTAPPSTAPATTIQVVSLTPTVSVAAPAVSVVANVNVVVTPSVQVGSETTTTTTSPAVTLPATGSSSTPALVAAGGALTVVGWAIRRLARRTPLLSH